VAEQPGLEFAGLLRQLRAEARLTQEELAEAAGLSPRSVSDLERGVHRTAQKDTAQLLAGALGLADPARALFVAAARGRRPAAACWRPGRRPSRVLQRPRPPGPCPGIPSVLLHRPRQRTCAAAAGAGACGVARRDALDSRH